MAVYSQQVEDVKNVFDAEDIEKVWEYLKVKFGFNVKVWKGEFENEIGIFPRFTSKQELFMIYGKKKIEPLLNIILKRDKYPTWINLLTYVLREKIERRKKIENLYKDRWQK